MLVGLLITPFALTNSSAHASDDCGRLTVGWIDWPPYQMADTTSRGGPVGVDIDAAEKYLGRLGCELEYIQQPWARLLKQMKEGKLDVLLGMSNTQERRQYARFSKAYRNETLWLFMKAGRTEFDSFKRLHDIIGTTFRLGVSRNAYLGKEFDALNKNPEFRERVFKNIGGEKFQMLIGGRVDGFMVDMETGKARIREEGLEGLIVPHKSLKIDLGTIHIMFGRNSISDELLTRLNEIIDQDIFLEQNSALPGSSATPNS